MYGQKTYRKRPLFHAASISSEEGSADKRSIGRLSLASKRSGGLSRKSAGSEIVEGLRQDSKWLKPREYLLLAIEAAMSLTAFVIRERNLGTDELERVNLTTRAANIYMIYYEGYSSLFCLVIAVLADSYFRYYTVALFTVILHFAAVCLVFMEDTIKGNQRGRPYAQLLWTVCTVSLCLIKASDFTRLVYGLEGMTNRKRSTVFIFIFLHFWVSPYATYGGIFVNIFHGFFEYIQLKSTVAAFVMSGISLYLFVYILRAEGSKRENSGLGCKVIGCLLLASYYKIFRVRKRGKRGFLGSTEGKYDKVTISRAKELFWLYLLLAPTIGLIFHTMIRSSIFYPNIWDKLKGNQLTKVVGISRLGRAVTAVTMVVSYFGLWPLLTFIGLKDRAAVKLLVGNLLSLLTLYYAAILMKLVENPEFTPSSGFVRLFNTRTYPIYMNPEDRDFTTHDFHVDPKAGVMVAYPCAIESLFAMRAVFNGTTTNFSVFLSVAPNEASGYMVLDPPQIARIRGPYLPLREGPPGTNLGTWPRIYFYNTAETLQGSSVKIRFPNQKKTLREILLKAGAVTTISIEPATYEFSISQADISKTFAIEEGGVYGIMIYATTTSREMDIDPVVPPNTASWLSYMGQHVLNGFAAGLSYPTMRGIIFSIAPHGLPAMSFGGVIFLEGICLWISYMGFRTWHYYVTSTNIFVYAFGETLFFLLNMFVLLKFRDSYS